MPQVLSQLMRERWANPKFREERITAIKKGMATPEVRKKYSEAQKRVWADPTKRKKISLAIRNGFDSPDVREKMSISAKRRYSNPIEKRKGLNRIKQLWANPEYRAKLLTDRRNRTPETFKKISKTVKELWTDPEYKANQISKHQSRSQETSETVKKSWANPQERENHMKGITHPDVIKKISEISKKHWNNPVIRKKILMGLARARVENKNMCFESVAHVNLKLTVGSILLTHGFNIQYEQPLSRDRPFYIIDVYGTKGDVDVLVEVGRCKVKKRMYLSANFPHFYHIPYGGDLNKIREVYT